MCNPMMQVSNEVEVEGDELSLASVLKSLFD